MDKIVIYCYHCIPTGKKYVGLTGDEKQRKRHHRWLAMEKDSQQAFHRAIRKYGWDSFIYGVIEQTDDKNREAHWIQQLNTMSEGYNMTSGGEYNKPTQEVRDRISATSKGRITTKETREKLSIAGKNRKLTDTHKEKVRQYREITYEIEYTNGEVEIVKGMKQYCIERGYNRSCMVKMISGKSKRHKDIIRVTRIGRV